MDRPAATLRMYLEADSGFESESEHRITLEQWEKINRVLNGTEEQLSSATGCLAAPHKEK